MDQTYSRTFLADRNTLALGGLVLAAIVAFAVVAGGIGDARGGQVEIDVERAPAVLPERDDFNQNPRLNPVAPSTSTAVTGVAERDDFNQNPRQNAVAPRTHEVSMTTIEVDDANQNPRQNGSR